MTQRIFDVDNPQDVKDLFDILPSEIISIHRYDVDSVQLVGGQNGPYVTDILSINWLNKTKIVRPVDESQLIGKLCWFTGSGATCEYIGVLKAIVKSRSDKYQMENGGFYSYCRPVRRDEIKFVEDME